MALTDSSTLDDAQSQLSNNLAWEGNATKITAALEAVRWLLFFRLNSSGDGDGQTWSYEGLIEMEKRLTIAKNQASVANAVTGQRVTRTFVEF